MVGGGKDAFIGAVHRIAANIDGQIELCCGALSINPEIARESGEMLFLPEDRTYLTYQEMIEKEKPAACRQAHRFCNHCHSKLCTFLPRQ